MWLRETNVHMYTLEGNILSRCFVITWCSCSWSTGDSPAVVGCGTASYCVKLAAIFGRARVTPFPVSPSAGYLHTNLQPEQGQSSRGNPPLQVSAEADEKNFNDRPVALLCTNIIHRKEYHESRVCYIYMPASMPSHQLLALETLQLLALETHQLLALETQVDMHDDILVAASMTGLNPSHGLQPCKKSC